MTPNLPLLLNLEDLLRQEVVALALSKEYFLAHKKLLIKVTNVTHPRVSPSVHVALNYLSICHNIVHGHHCDVLSSILTSQLPVDNILPFRQSIYSLGRQVE